MLFPKTCFGCGSYGSYLCTSCIKRKTVVRWNQTCHVCNRSVTHGLVHNECSESTYLDGVFAMFVYDGLVKQLIQEVKYNYSYDIFADIGNKMGKFSSILPKFNNSVITSVPLHSKKKRLRGFNQAEVLARQVARFQGISYTEVLQRKKYTQTQVGMKKTEREINLKSAFSLEVEKSKILKTNKSVIIVDDVYTTGTTLNECAKVIKDTFPDVKVYGYTLARAPGGTID